jgi:hypothetical protein
MVMITSEKATQKSMTHPSLAVPNAPQRSSTQAARAARRHRHRRQLRLLQLFSLAAVSIGQPKLWKRVDTCRKRTSLRPVVSLKKSYNEGNLDVLDELVPPEWLHHDPASLEEERGSEGALRQRREISEPLKGNAKSPKVTRGPVGERVRRLAGVPDLRRSSRSIPSAGSSNSSPSERMGTSPLARSRSTNRRSSG